MTLRKLALASLGSLALVGCLGLPPRPTSIKLFDAENQLVGFVDFLKIKGGVRIRVHTLGLPGGVKGLNIHANPVCDPPGFSSAGPIFRRAGKGVDSLIAGDLPDITAGAREWADTTLDWEAVRLDGSERGLFRNGGTSLVITATPDRGPAGPDGRSDRIACGIIKERPEER